jgi:CCR4-NOT transcription complex subunit 6
MQQQQQQSQQQQSQQQQQQQQSQQFKGQPSRNGLYTPDVYAQQNNGAAANGPAGWGAADPRPSLYQVANNDVKINTELMYKQLQAAEQSRQSNTSHHFSRLFAAQARTQNKFLADPASASESTVNGRHRKDGPPLAAEDMVQAGRTRPGDIVVEKQAWTTLDFSGAGISHLNRDIWRFTFLTCLYLNNNRLTVLPKEIGLLKGLTRLDVSGNQLTSVPPQLGMLTNLKELLLFDNDIQNLPNELGTLYQLELLGLEGNPLLDPFKSIFLRDGTHGLIQYLLETKPLGRGPIERDWKQIQDVPASDPDRNLFSILCYNVLCERYATDYMYGYTPKYALVWDYRKKLILDELLNYNPDIACLQEINRETFNEFINGELGAVDDNGKGGYKGVFWQKTRAGHMPSDESQKVDGCAIFYKSEWSPPPQNPL